jgi:thiol-disulfide isomerase/thioredoxin
VPVTATLAWKLGLATLHVTVPAGEHVAPDAPARLVVGPASADLVGDPSGVTLRVPAGPVEATVALAVCKLDGSRCRPVTLAGSGVLGAGQRIALSEFTTSPAATATGRVAKVYDFAAEWCPPCQLLAAEFLDVERGLPPVERVDVDLAGSWDLKSRYQVGGYPTLLAVDQGGGEIDRLVGYPGAPATRAWFDTLGSAATREELQAGVELSGAAAASAARRLAETQDEEGARRYLATADDGVDTHVARLLVDGRAEDARWLVEHRSPPGDWLIAAMEADPTLVGPAAAMIAALPPMLASDAFDAAAGKETDVARATALRAGALALVRAGQSGDFDEDRGYITTESSLLCKLGHVDAAIARLESFAAHYPAEFTWPFAAANRLLDADRPADAESFARRAWILARGDERYRAAMTLAKVLAATARKDEARAVLDEVLLDAAPAQDVAVRTHRYRADVSAQRGRLE